MEGALQAKLQIQDDGKGKKKKGRKYNANKGDVGTNSNGGKHLPCQHCGRTNHPQYKCWRRLDVRCRKCNQIGHMEKICKNEGNQHKNEAQVADQQVEEQLFVATCFASSSSSDCWLIDSGCTNHMTNDEELFRELDKSAISKVRIGKGEHIAVKGRGIVAIESLSGTKLITDVLYVSNIDQNLLSVG